MKKTNTLTDLVLDLFDFLVEKYGITSIEEKRINGNTLATKIAKLPLYEEDHLFSPCIALVPMSRVSLKLKVFNDTPSIEHASNEDDYFEVRPVQNGINLLSIWSGEYLSGFSCLLMSDEDEEMSKLRLTIITKVHELYYSGKYNTNRINVRNKESLSV